MLFIRHTTEGSEVVLRSHTGRISENAVLVLLLYEGSPSCKLAVYDIRIALQLV